MDAPLLVIDNLHHESCETAPSIIKRSGDECYLGYFENEHGEQFILEVNRSTGRGFVQAGDLGWGCKIEIRDNQIQSDVVLGESERQWLSACWHSATGRELQSVAEKEVSELADDSEPKRNNLNFSKLNQKIEKIICQQNNDDESPATLTLTREELLFLLGPVLVFGGCKSETEFKSKLKQILENIIESDEVKC